MKARVLSSIRAADALVGRGYLSLFRERASLLTFLFHGLFEDEAEVARNAAEPRLEPQQRTTVAQFREFVAYYVARGYRFVTPAEVLGGLEPGGRYALITFDDGYRNNARALPVMREFGVPAVFFISTNHVRRGKAFWWDVHYRRRSAAGASLGEIRRELTRMKGRTTASIERELLRDLGPGALDPVGDLDRPFTPAELRAFSREPGVFLGNHTADHAILTSYSDAGAARQVAEAQEQLEEMTGVVADFVAYPNGNYTREIVRACEGLGLRLGITTEPRKNRLPADLRGGGLMRLGRFTLYGDGDVAAQCAMFRSDLQLYNGLRAAFGGAVV